MATKKVYLNTIAQLAGKLSTAFISIFLIKILTNYLNLESYGLYSKVYNYLSIFAVIADMGLFTITIREISANKDHKETVHKIIGNMMTIRMFLGVLIIFLSVAIAYFLPGYDSRLALWSIFITSFFVFFGLMNSAIISLLQAYLKTEFTFVSQTVGKLSSFLFVLAIVFVFYPKSLIAGNPDLAFNAFLWIMSAGVFGNVLTTLIIYNYARKVEKISFRFDMSHIKNLVKNSIPYGLALFLNVVYFKIDVIMLSVMLPKDTVDESIALYAVPMKIVEVGMLFGGLFLQSMLPLFTQAIQKKDSEGMRELVTKSYRILFMFGVGIVGFSIVNGYEILRLIANPQYLDHTKYFYNSLDSYRITVFVFLFCFISSIFTYILIANNEQSKLLKLNFYLTLINIIGNLILIPKYSFIGSSVATLFSEVIMLTNTYLASRHIYAFDFSPRFTSTTLLVAAVAGAVTFLLRGFLYLFFSSYVPVLAICIVVFFSIFFGLLVVLFYRSAISSFFARRR